MQNEISLCWRPTVRVIARPSLDREAVLAFTNGESWIQEDEIPPTDGDSLIEAAGRVCYNSFGNKQGRRKNADYIRNLVERGHGSVLEHAQWTFLVSGCSRGFTHELVRHRAGFAFSQESTHYIDYTQGFTLCIDPILTTEPAVAERVVQGARQALESYLRVIVHCRANGMSKKDACQAARALLPIGIESRIAFSANARALRHFVEYRGHRGNVTEMRTVACDVAELMLVEAPAAFIGIAVQDGEVLSMYRKV